MVGFGTAPLVALSMMVTMAAPTAASPVAISAPTRPHDLAAVDIVPEGITGAPASAHLAERIGAEAWHAIGRTGAGVTIAVVDYIDVARYWTPSMGAAPTAADTKCLRAGSDCAATFFDGVDTGGEQHGAAVAAIVRAVAPDARIVLGQARTISDYRALIDWFAEQGVDVITRSLGSRYDGPGDGRGALDEVAEYAVGKGILWVNSGGNNGTGQYYRGDVKVGSDGWLVLDGSHYLAFEGRAQLAGVRWANDWDVPAAARSDYDVFLYRAPDGHPEQGTLIASSTLRQTHAATPLESIPGPFQPGAGERLYLAVQRVSGDPTGDVLEILDYGDGIVGATSLAGSAATPIVDSRSPGVVSVGAIDPPGSGEVASYSAQGPTNDGRLVPTLTAPVSYPNAVNGAFAGTSAAAPVVAAAAALIHGAGLTTTPAELAEQLRAWAIDRGPAGADNAFGAGEVHLPDPNPNDSPAAPPGPEPAESGARYTPVPPARLLDTRTDPAGPMQAGETRRLQVGGAAGVPAGDVTAVAVNVVTVAPDGASFLQLMPTGRTLPGTYSNVNADAPGQARANLAIVPVGEAGSLSLYASATGDVVIDVLGYFTPSVANPTGGRFEALARPDRTLDTRLGGGPMQALQQRQVPMPAGVDPNLVSALVVTVTATDATEPGWVQAVPSDRPDLIGATSTLNVAAGESVANMAVVPVGSSGMSVVAYFGTGTGHVVVDVVGYITSEAAPAAARGRFVAVAPERAFDSGRPLASRELVGVRSATVPSDASAVVWNVAVVGAASPGFARAWASGAPEPSTSALNWSTAGETRAAAVISGAGAGVSQFLIDGGSPAGAPLGGLIVDVFGYFTS